MLLRIFFHNRVQVPFFFSEMLNTFETFKVTAMRTFKHEPFIFVGGRGGGELYLWYFTVLMNRKSY